ncbi:MAG: hypothetical protein U0271_40205 [Polyangiaceae bacterium]
MPETEHHSTVEEKYWEILVDFPNDQDYPTKGGLQRITSYLRLGTAEALTPTNTTRGHDLANLVQDFIDDTRKRSANIEEDGSRTPALTRANRADESNALHTKGGWRDHSDGNRITTTRGDKVEVIRGNYKLLVLGRQDEDSNGASWEASGGLIQDGDIAPGSITEIRWVQDPYGGTWRVIEETTKGDTVTRYHGDVDEAYYGLKITSTIGSETPTSSIPKGSAQPRAAADAGETLGREAWADPGIDEAVVKRANPAIVERTWATKIESYTGSQACPVPTIDEKTWATTVTETATLGSSTSRTTVTGEINETTTAAKLVEAGNFQSTSSTTTVSGNITETTTAASINSKTTVSGELNEDTNVGSLVTKEVVSGLSDAFSTAAKKQDIALVGANLGIIVAGAMLDIEVSALRGEVKAGVAFLEIEAAVIYVELFLGIKMEINVAREIKYDTSSSEFSLEKKIGIGL